jgi:hypothetical protein
MRSAASGDLLVEFEKRLLFRETPEQVARLDRIDSRSHCRAANDPSHTIAASRSLHSAAIPDCGQ